MNIKHLGSQYGGYHIDIDSINDGDNILSLGVGTDYSFDIDLYNLKPVNIIAVDPTEKSLQYHIQNGPEYISFINKAVYIEDSCLIDLYKNKNPSYVSDSIDAEIKDVSSDKYQVKTVSIKTLVSTYDPSLIKMDIEGAEYLVYEQCFGVKQVCLESHDYRTDRDDSRDKKMIDRFLENGYDLICNANHTYSFLRA
jgi:FkbM family methyltransferase